MKKLLSCLVTQVKGRTGTCIILRLEVICGQTRSAIEDALGGTSVTREEVPPFQMRGGKHSFTNIRAIHSRESASSFSSLCPAKISLIRCLVAVRHNRRDREEKKKASQR